MRSRTITFVLCLLVAFGLVVGCAPRPSPTPVSLPEVTPVVTQPPGPTQPAVIPIPIAEGSCLPAQARPPVADLGPTKVVQVGKLQVEIPTSFVQVKGQPVSGGSAKTVIIIEEIHTLVKIQKEILATLNALRQDGIPFFIALEGASGPVHTGYFRSLPEHLCVKGLKHGFAWVTLEDANVSAPEYIGITAQPEIHIYGIEDLDLFEEHRQQADEVNKQFKEILQDLQGVLEELEPKLNQEELRDLNAKIQALIDGDMEFHDFYGYVKKLAAKHKVAVPGPDRKALQVYDRFYELICLRDEAFVENTLAHMDATGVNVAAMIAGAAHTPCMQDLLEQEDVSYLVLSPVSLEEATKLDLDTLPEPEKQRVEYENERFSERSDNRITRFCMGFFGPDCVKQSAGSSGGALKNPTTVDKPGFHREAEFALQAGTLYWLYRGGIPLAQAQQEVEKTYPHAKSKVTGLFVSSGDLYVRLDIEDRQALIRLTEDEINYYPMPEAPVLAHGRITPGLFYEVIDRTYLTDAKRRRVLIDERSRRKAALYSDSNQWIAYVYTENGDLLVQVGDADPMPVAQWVESLPDNGGAGQPPIIISTAGAYDDEPDGGPSRDALASLDRRLRAKGYRTYFTTDPRYARVNLREVQDNKVRRNNVVFYEVTASLSDEQRRRLRLREMLAEKHMSDLLIDSPEALAARLKAVNVLVISGHNSDEFLTELHRLGQAGALRGRIVAVVSCPEKEQYSVEAIPSILDTYGAVSAIVFREPLEATAAGAMLAEFAEILRTEADTTDFSLEDALRRSIERVLEVNKEQLYQRLLENETHVELIPGPTTDAMA